MTLASATQWVSLAALLLSIGNMIWAWISRPARDMGHRIDQTDERVNELVADVNARADRHREDLKVHDRRIQKLENELVHLPTKDDLRALELSITGIRTELDIVARTVSRIDEFLRSK